MRYTFALAALCSIAAASPSPVAAPEPIPQGVTQKIAPTDTPASCLPTYEGGDYFQIGLIQPGASRKRAVSPGVNPFLLPGNILLLSLQNGVIKDAQNRTGYIASTGQLQFDDPPQAGAIYTSGFSACLNATLALESTTFYTCGSGGFSNLYSTNQGGQCSPINLGIFLYQGDVSSAIAGISAASTTGQLPAYMSSAMGSSATGMAIATSEAMATTSSGGAMSTGGMMASSSGMASSGGMARSGASSTDMATTTSGGSMGSMTATGAMSSSTGASGASANSVGKSLAGLAAMIGLSALVL